MELVVVINPWISMLPNCPCHGKDLFHQNLILASKTPSHPFCKIWCVWTEIWPPSCEANHIFWASEHSDSACATDSSFSPQHVQMGSICNPGSQIGSNRQDIFTCPPYEIVATFTFQIFYQISPVTAQVDLIQNYSLIMRDVNLSSLNMLHLQ